MVVIYMDGIKGRPRGVRNDKGSKLLSEPPINKVRNLVYSAHEEVTLEMLNAISKNGSRTWKTRQEAEMHSYQLTKKNIKHFVYDLYDHKYGEKVFIGVLVSIPEYDKEKGIKKNPNPLSMRTNYE